jgi:hypothetical protein
MWPIPPMWREDAIVDMIFLGIIKTVVCMVMHWFNQRGKLNELFGYLKGAMEAKMEFNLDG